jgi:hypothetical protein
MANWWGSDKPISKIKCRLVVPDPKGGWNIVHRGTYDACEKYAYSHNIDEFEIQRESTGEML